jgi:hypothetical protein
MKEETALQVGTREMRTEELAFEIGILVREHLRAGEPSREKVYECLNALAIHAATILAGADNDPEAFEFFIGALNQQMRFLGEGGLGKGAWG